MVVRSGLTACAVVAAAGGPLPAAAQQAGVATAADPVPVRQSADDAWFTGPMLANSPATLPSGRALVETYVFDQISDGSELHGSLTYLLYGVTDRLTMGVKPAFGIRRAGGRSSGFGVGDLTLSAQYRLTPPDAPAGVPTIAVSLQQGVPIARYDRLERRPANGLGSGADVTTLGLYGQQYFWLPNGRILRGRVNLSRTFSGAARVRGKSVYGTGPGFRGRARPGETFALGLAGEYSMTRSWVLALDLVYSRTGTTRVSGEVTSTVSPASESVAIAPGIEYSWKPNLGVLLAARFVPESKNTSRSVTPAVAINYVF